MSLTEEQVAEMIKEGVAKILAEERAARPVANPSPKQLRAVLQDKFPDIEYGKVGFRGIPRLQRNEMVAYVATECRLSAKQASTKIAKCLSNAINHQKLLQKPVEERRALQVKSAEVMKRMRLRKSFLHGRRIKPRTQEAEDALNSLTPEQEAQFGLRCKSRGGSSDNTDDSDGGTSEPASQASD